ncbi:hypothetical protein O181_056515 [Austropuccinia psidii MF-1]|uniref:Chromo domain-containing protein n=1 Tax=Austropuccinia psidii MF-1 TaxID=1389203 RepID=A0A9Q3ECT8_9BASI|nr:hypothetical protein [Austropuccinia psidii MF-1]
MPFGLTNGPASFQNLVNDIFSDFLDIFVEAYLVDIIVFFSSEEEHIKHVASFLQRLRDNKVFAKASKCVFHATIVEYLCNVVSSDGLKMQSSKAQQILNWPQPKNIKDLQYFLGFANSYGHFIKNYSKKSLLSLPFSKKTPFIFNKESLSQFKILKEAFTTTPILSNFNLSLATDASYSALGAVLRRLATLPDALSPQDYVYPDRGVDFISKNPQNFHQIIKQDGIKESKLFSIKVEILPYLVDRIQNKVWQDKDYKEILKQLARGESVSKYSLEPQAKLLLFKDRVVIPSNEESQLNILQKCHDSTLAGYPGQEKTLKLIKRDLYWDGINQSIKDYVSSFLKKIGSHAYHLKLPQQWKSVHPVFHVSFFKPVKQSTILNQHQLSPPPVIVEEQEEWEVAQVQNSKLKRGILWYLVEWKGCSAYPERTTWEQASNLTSSPDLVKSFHSFYPDKPGPITSRV